MEQSSSSPTRVLPPSSPPTGVPSPAYKCIKQLVYDIELEMDYIQYQPNFFFDRKLVDRLLYLSQLANYWQDVYLVLYGERL